ncbi:hypothetical protein MGA3_17592 (plasmid) [Bacillus methanolicus MGA3]|uniref:Uncharacterized protein n=1 Tax=Bacillus methanolicus (strain MGA3 / ATCC 53907) TaxID=796606 RepID=I3DTG3_BACMM|nr:hypothetical protein BMMGA3_16945 [Bacillus methanolicus MGA3]EIJ77534.1 hypothetical protein MGA3_17592 [Bacillus methanolicus MGA3]
MMFLGVYLGGDFLWTKKEQTFNSYSVDLKIKVVRLKLEKGWSYRYCPLME